MTSSSGTQWAGKGSSSSRWKHLRKVSKVPLASRDVLLPLTGVEGLVPDWSPARNQVTSKSVGHCLTETVFFL